MQNIGKSNLQGSRIALGCMRMGTLDNKQAAKVLTTALETGINFFDHADIYGGGQSELVFAQAMSDTNTKRENVILQSKCGIQKGYFDFSKEHILTSVDSILKRLNTDYLDILALHRPDALMEGEEVAEAFRLLKDSGKVHHFGVSNQNRYQMELLQSYLDEPLVVNQLQLSPAHTPMIDSGLTVNMWENGASNRDGGIIDYCRLHNVTIQAWSPFQVTLQHGLFFNDPNYAKLTETLKKYATQYGVTKEAITVAWIMRHPAKIQTIIGSMNTSRLRDIAKAESVQLTRPEWYDIYTSAGNILP